MNTPATNHKSESNRPDSPDFGKAISLWFAISSPLTGLIIGFLGAWFYTWMTS